MTALATFALFFGIMLVFVLGMITGAALAGMARNRDGYGAFDGGYRHDNDKPTVHTRIWGGGIEETKH